MIWRPGGWIDLKIVPIRHHAPIAAAHGRPLWFSCATGERDRQVDPSSGWAGENQATLGSSSTTREGPQKLPQYGRPGEGREVASQSIETAHEPGRIKSGPL